MSTASYTTGELAGALGARLLGPADLAVTHVETLERGGAGAVSFIRSKQFLAAWAQSRASCALLPKDLEPLLPTPVTQGRALLLVDDADLALNKVLELFAPPPPPPAPGVHASAVIDPSARIAPGVRVGPLCVIEAGAIVENGAVLTAQVYVGAKARIGEGSVLHAGCRVMDRCVIGRRCILHAGSVIGADGFGYRPTPAGLSKIPHIGDVTLGDDVEVGANTCIDRAKFGSTLIGTGTKIDNLVQIGHNCRVGRHCIICGQCGLAGSVTLGDGAILAGQVGVADNLSIGAGARVGAKTGVSTDIPAGQTWTGHIPASPAREHSINAALFRRLGELLRPGRGKKDRNAR